MGKRGFHYWAWLVVLLLGGLLMLYGGAHDSTLFFWPEGNLAPVPSWHSVPHLVGLVCGLLVLASAGLNVVWGWRCKWQGEIPVPRKMILPVIRKLKIPIPLTHQKHEYRHQSSSTYSGYNFFKQSGQMLWLN